MLLSQPDRRPLGADGRNRRPSNHHNQRRHNWTIARVTIPDVQAATDLLAETKKRPITAHGKKLKFAPANKKNIIPLEAIRRLLAVPYGGKQTIIREQTADSLRRGTNLHLFQLGTINRDAEFATEHTVYDANKVPMAPASTPIRHQNGRKPDKRPRPTEYPEYRCIIGCEPGFRGMYVRILKKEKTMTFRMNIRTIEQICWSPSSSAPPPEAWLPRKHKQKTVLAKPIPKKSDDDDGDADYLTAEDGFDEEDDFDDDLPEAQDVIIRLSQPLVLEQTIRTTNHRTRLSAIPSKPHISPYCFTTLFISGYNLVETLQSMSSMYNSPIPWELHIQKSSWRRYQSNALRLVAEKLKTMSIALAFQYQVDCTYPGT